MLLGVAQQDITLLSNEQDMKFKSWYAEKDGFDMLVMNYIEI